MSWLFPSSFRHAALLGCAAALLLGTGAAQPVLAASGPFIGYSGAWSGSGTLRTEQRTERVRCNATYEVRDSSGHALGLELICHSDDYNFDLVADVQADASNRVTGRFSEQTRHIGGTLIGRARDDRLQIHAESSAFSADVGMTTRGRRQSVTIDSHGGGQTVRASITLRRSSR
ncbi:MAG TPA: hypothetical protein VFT69_11535 [Pseudolabrys sp.]|jgi:hypothetical protein|nr:hypothetical protein [Pseudolabrys sp.]